MTLSSSRIFGVSVVITILFLGIIFTLFMYRSTEEDRVGTTDLANGVKTIEKQYSFSFPEISEKKEYSYIKVREADINSIHDQWPILPVNITIFNLPFASEILTVETKHSTPVNISLSKPVSYGSCSTLTKESNTIYYSNKMYPSSFVSYHTGGGLTNGEHKTFLSIRVYPVTYSPGLNTAYFIENLTVTITYKEPKLRIFEGIDGYDLLIITPEEFTEPLQDFVDHKREQGIQTEIATVESIGKKTLGRDLQEKIKYYIKQELDYFGIQYVLLVGGIDGRSNNWNLPVRYSHVLIREGTQELIEPAFISDLYYADIYNSTGNFSSWDTNNNDVFGENDEGVIDKMDLYPDVNIGRLPCRNKKEVNIIVDKIIAYETQTKNSEWFKNLILISGDHWDDENQINEGVLIMEEAAEIMDDYNPVELFATEDNILLTRDIRKVMNHGAGFAYFCGHGSPSVWGIHYPPDSSGWAPSLTRLKLIPFYKNVHMNLLHNKNRLPVTLVGGCNNGQFDLTFFNNLKQGKLSFVPHCWAWHLTIQKRGGSIATIANTGLGTHAMDDNDNNGVNDYLEVLDGWLELKFFELYQDNNIDILGQTQQEAITQYLHTFLGAKDEMDVKMVQQWQLFGDPTLKIGGY